MAAGGEIVSYWAGMRINVPPGEIAKVDRLLADISARFRKFNSGLNSRIDLSKSIGLDQSKLRRQVGDALDRVSRSTFLSIENFRIDDARLTQSLNQAMRRVSGNVQAGIAPNIKPQRGQGQGGNVRQVYNTSTEGGEPYFRRGPRFGLGIGGLGFLGAAGAAYAATRTVGNIYDANKQAVQSRLNVENSVGGSDQANRANFDYLRALSDQYGLNYQEASESFGKIIANSKASGMGAGAGRGIFKGISALATIYHLPNEKQGRIYKGLSDIMSKGTVMSEELKGQLADNGLPGIVQMFAAEWADRNKSGLTGQDAVTALFAAMKKGEVKSDILPGVAQRAYDFANSHGLEKSSQTSQAQENRLANTRADIVQNASQAGLEEGFAAILKAANIFTNDLNPASTELAKSFGSAAKDIAAFSLGIRQTYMENKGKATPSGPTSIGGTVPIPGTSQDDPNPGYLTPKKYNEAKPLLGRPISEILGQWIGEGKSRLDNYLENSRRPSRGLIDRTLNNADDIPNPVKQNEGWMLPFKNPPKLDGSGFGDSSENLLKSLQPSVNNTNSNNTITLSPSYNIRIDGQVAANANAMDVSDWVKNSVENQNQSLLTELSSVYGVKTGR